MEKDAGFYLLHDKWSDIVVASSSLPLFLKWTHSLEKFLQRKYRKKSIQTQVQRQMNTDTLVWKLTHTYMCVCNFLLIVIYELASIYIHKLNLLDL